MSHIRKEAREGTSRYLSDRLGGTSGRVKNLEVGKTNRTLRLNCPDAGETLIREAFEPSSATRTAFDEAASSHNLHNCRTIWIQPNVPPRTPIITLARPSKHHAIVISSSPSRRTTRETAHTTLKRGKSRDRRVQHT